MIGWENPIFRTHAKSSACFCACFVINFSINANALADIVSCTHRGFVKKKRNHENKYRLSSRLHNRGVVNKEPQSAHRLIWRHKLGNATRAQDVMHYRIDHDRDYGDCFLCAFLRLRSIIIVEISVGVRIRGQSLFCTVRVGGSFAGKGFPSNAKMDVIPCDRIWLIRKFHNSKGQDFVLDGGHVMRKISIKKRRKRGMCETTHWRRQRAFSQPTFRTNLFACPMIDIGSKSPQ